MNFEIFFYMKQIFFSASDTSRFLFLEAGNNKFLDSETQKSFETEYQDPCKRELNNYRDFLNGSRDYTKFYQEKNVGEYSKKICQDLNNRLDKSVEAILENTTDLYKNAKCVPGVVPMEQAGILEKKTVYQSSEKGGVQGYNHPDSIELRGTDQIILKTPDGKGTVMICDHFVQDPNSSKCEKIGRSIVIDKGDVRVTLYPGLDTFPKVETRIGRRPDGNGGFENVYKLETSHIPKDSTAKPSGQFGDRVGDLIGVLTSSEIEISRTLDATKDKEAKYANDISAKKESFLAGKQLQKYLDAISSQEK